MRSTAPDRRSCHPAIWLGKWLELRKHLSEDPRRPQVVTMPTRGSVGTRCSTLRCCGLDGSVGSLLGGGTVDDPLLVDRLGADLCRACKSDDSGRGPFGRVPLGLLRDERPGYRRWCAFDYRDHYRQALPYARNSTLSRLQQAHSKRRTVLNPASLRTRGSDNAHQRTEFVIYDKRV